MRNTLERGERGDDGAGVRLRASDDDKRSISKTMT